MGHAGGTKTTTTAAAGATLAGLAVIIHGIAYDNLAHSIGGLGVTTIGLTAVGLTLIRQWVTDTTAERNNLAAAQRVAEEERSRAFAEQAALEGERSRLYKDLQSARAADEERLAVERSAMEREFEDARTELVNNSMSILASWVVGGKVRPPERKSGTVIHFPDQKPAVAPQRERSREHGVVGP